MKIIYYRVNINIYIIILPQIFYLFIKFKLTKIFWKINTYMGKTPLKGKIKILNKLKMYQHSLKSVANEEENDHKRSLNRKTMGEL